LAEISDKMLASSAALLTGLFSAAILSKRPSIAEHDNLIFEATNEGIPR